MLIFKIWLNVFSVA